MLVTTLPRSSMFAHAFYPRTLHFYPACCLVVHACVIARRCIPAPILRSVGALEADLQLLDGEYNKCSDMMARGEQNDFDQAWLAPINILLCLAALKPSQVEHLYCI